MTVILFLYEPKISIIWFNFNDMNKNIHIIGVELILAVTMRMQQP